MVVFWKKRQPGLAGSSQALENERFLIRAARVYCEVGRELFGILGKNVLQPRLAINPRPRKCNFGALRIERGEVTVLLNPEEGVTRQFAMHELVHIARLQSNGKLETGVRKSIEEACSIVGECSTAAMDLDKASAKVAVLGFLSMTKTSPDPFAAALSIIASFTEQEKNASGEFGSAFEISDSARITTHMERALRKTENSINTDQWEDPRFAPIEHKVGAGIALLLFVMNDFDVRLSVKEACETPVSEMILRLASKILADGKEMDGELNRLRNFVAK